MQSSEFKAINQKVDDYIRSKKLAMERDDYVSYTTSHHGYPIPIFRFSKLKDNLKWNLARALKKQLSENNLDGEYMSYLLMAASEANSAIEKRWKNPDADDIDRKELTPDTKEFENDPLWFELFNYANDEVKSNPTKLNPATIQSAILFKPTSAYNIKKLMEYEVFLKNRATQLQQLEATIIVSEKSHGIVGAVDSNLQKVIYNYYVFLNPASAENQKELHNDDKLKFIELKNFKGEGGEGPSGEAPSPILRDIQAKSGSPPLSKAEGAGPPSSIIAQDSPVLSKKKKSAPAPKPGAPKSGAGPGGGKMNS